MKKSGVGGLVASLVVVIAFAATASAATTPVDLLKVFKPQLAQIKNKSRVPVLLPKSLPILTNKKVYATGGGDKSGWDLELAFAPRCGSATACFVAAFTGERGTKLPIKANVRLANGERAAFKPSTCGASCSPASIWFVHDGYLYSWQHSEVTRKAAKALLVRLANEAIAAGPR